MLRFKKSLAAVLGIVFFQTMAFAEGQLLSKILPGEDLSPTWKVRAIPMEGLSEGITAYQVTDYPKASGETEESYASPRDKGQTFDSFVLSPLLKHHALGDFGGKQDGTVGQWIEEGLSTHVFISTAGIPVLWVDPESSKAQMAGNCNDRSLEGLIRVDKDQNVSQVQIKTLEAIINHFKKPDDVDYPIHIQYLGDHAEARDSKEAGTITNINYLRKELGLSPLPKIDA